MENKKRFIALVIRVVIAFLFLLSAVAKMYPSPYFAISTFEVKQLYPMGFTEESAAFFSRTLIGIEFALGLLLLQRNFLKRLVVPATIVMLVVFIIHLTIDTISNGNAGSCGCFGELLPMTPVAAIIKNVISVALLVWLYRLIPADYDKRNFWVLTTITFASILGVFMVAPIQPRQYDVTVEETTETPLDTITTVPTLVDTIPATDTETTATQQPTEAQAEKPAAVADEPAKAKSMYSQYFASADKGKKIIGLFAPGCDHCRDVAKELTQMRAKNKDLPEMLVIFMDEETNLIPEFLEYAGAKYPYKVVDVITFWKLVENGDTPGVVYQWNGNKIKLWDGINENEFKGSELLKLYKKPYSELKR